jgi:hypothetical protein
MLKYSEPTRSRIHDGIKKYSRIVAQARQRGMNERDTGDIVKAMLGDMLGYDPFFDVTAEISMRGLCADYAVLTEERLRFLVMVKAIGIPPHASHLLNLSGTNAPAYVQWVLLSNADDWSCYRLGVGADRHAELVFHTALLDSTPVEEKIALFFLLSKEGLQQDALTQYWEQIRVLNPGRLVNLLLSEEVLNLLRRELQRTANYRIDRQSLQNILMRDVLRSEALEARGQEAPPPAPRFPQCYAYVRDPHNPTTWRFGYRNPDGTPNPEMLTLAVADLHSGPNAVGVPADDFPLVKERLRLAYLELGVSFDDLPEILRF